MGCWTDVFLKKYSLVFLLFFYLSHLYWIDLVVSANFTISDYLALETECSSVGDSQKRKDEVISSELQLDVSSNDRICCVVIDNYTQEVDMGYICTLEDGAFSTEMSEWLVSDEPTTATIRVPCQIMRLCKGGH